MTTSSDNKAHFPFVTRMLVELWHQGELPDVESLWVEPTFGHMGRLVYRNGAVRLFRGSGMGLNNQGAADIARDKADTRSLLLALGYRVPHGRVFAHPSFGKRIAHQFGAEAAASLGSPQEAVAWAEAGPGYPYYVKPNNGAQGRGVSCCRNRDEFEAALAGFVREQIPLFLVEEAISWPEYRVVVLHERVVAAYERRPPTIVGDGVSTLQELIAVQRPALAGDPQLTARLQAQSPSLASIPAAEERIRLHDVANLSLGGSAADVTDRLAPEWQALCVRAVAEMGLRFCGVDLACADIRDGAAPYAIFELNSAPGLEHYAALGASQLAHVRALYRELFNQLPGSAARW